MKIIEESMNPEVGPFYIIDNTVFTDSEPLRDLMISSDDQTKFSIDSDNNHYDYWRSIKRVFPEFRDHDYDYYPRGRVVYKPSEDTFYVYIDKCLNNRKNIMSILNELNLPLKKVKISFDSHYQCHNCNKDYVDISEDYEGDA